MAELSIRDTLHDINLKVSAALQKRSKIRNTDDSDTSVTVIAVSKTQSSSNIQTAYEYGCRHFGENYVNELIEKANDDKMKELCPEIKWHFIGHLQSNKVKKLLEVPNLYMVQTVDTKKLADILNASWKKTHSLKIMVQVKLCSEKSKSGASLDDVDDLVGHIIENCPGLSLSGLMTIGEAHYDIETGKNPEFVELVKLRDRICEKVQIQNLEVSCGMSNDFEHAIEIGSTMVRIGTKIFGARQYFARQFPEITFKSIC